MAIIKNVLAVLWIATFAQGAGANLLSSYPANFLWGAAFSAHQTEGKFEGGENGDWYAFEHPILRPSPIDNGDTADLAVDHWNRYEEDYKNAKALGLNTLRTSIAWEKVNPQKGVFNSRAIEHYRVMFAKMRDMGLRPMICLSHFTHPKWFNQEGGWTNPNSPKYFLDYAKYVVDQLGEFTDLWITFNEPMILVQMGYIKGEIPPQKMGLNSGFEAAFNTARAHRMVAAYIHSVQGVPVIKPGDGQAIRGVGLAYSFQYFLPADPSRAEDRQAREVLMTLSNWAWLRGAETGHMEFRLIVPGKADQIWSRDLPPEDLPPNPGPVFDWLGVNYYQMYQTRYSSGMVPFEWITPKGLPLSDNGWAIYPEGLEAIIREVNSRFSYPLIVTENGVADAVDSRRPQHIRDHLKFLDKAVLGTAAGQAPIDIRGFYEWSLMDNFEWLHGYRYNFGLFKVDFGNNLARSARGSAAVYTEELRKRK